MGCSPYSNKKTKETPESIKDSIDNLPLSLRAITRKTTIQRLSNNTHGSSRKRYSTIPIQQSDFWGTMPLSVIIDRLSQFKDEVLKNKGNYNQGIEYIKKILYSLANNFEGSEYKTIKKNNNEFKKLLDKYKKGIHLMKILGFRVKDKNIEVDHALTEENAKYIVKEFEEAIDIVDKKMISILSS